MSTKIIYMSPNETLEIRIIKDSELPKNAKEWKYQVHPGSMMVKIAAADNLQFWDPMLRIDMIDISGKIRKSY